MHILLVEDETLLADVVRTGLQEMGHTVEVAHDGSQGEMLARMNAYDLLIVDWYLPRQDGRTLIQRLRATGSQTPILMLTARSEVEDMVSGLDAGADDYLTKPFAFEELFARVRALGRRSQHLHPPTVLSAGPLRIDSLRREVWIGNQRLSLQPREYAVLELLVRRYGAVVTRSTLAEAIWGSALGTSEDAINMTLSRLRQQIREALDGNPPITIQTVRGIGYRLAVD